MSSITLLSQRRDAHSKSLQQDRFHHRQYSSFTDKPFISVIVPMYNEEAVIEICHERLCRVLDELEQVCEIVYVDDGSKDASWELAQQFTSSIHRVRSIRLSRNFGKEAAMSAGLQAAEGQAIILLDADLQDPPELIPEMVAQWQAGFDVVDMKRKQRHGEGWFKRFTAATFYKLMNQLSEMPIPENVGDFRLIDRRVVDEINKLPERTRFMKGLLAWPGFHRTTLMFDRDPRLAGETKWNYTKLCHLAFEGITSFSTRPLRLATGAGLLTSAIAMVLAAVVLTKTLIWGDPVAGYPSTILVVLILGGIQLLSIGLMGEYVGRLFIESKQRPLFVVMDDKVKTEQDTKEEVQA
ncbi:glycosyltransferase [Photobacterium sanctipauli]|uniref:Glycosyltransferase n=1 Tax=Photobacterium sanctipauli TaxID=1342794 RepID=A0A2T3NUS6_9GAMM|nr:glycosyltransferase family 2 protein [Photobacterium sanctipauli]PSW19969.1 glycosyltransferase [Photobacterium sanctipauli]